MEYIRSIQNAKVKEWVRLLSKKGREQAGAFLIEGLHLVEEAIRAGASVQCLLVSEDISLEPQMEHLIHTHPASKYKISEAVVNKLAATESPQGIFAVVAMYPPSLETVWDGQPLLLILDALQDPGNLGTIIRTADAAGVDGIILGKGTVDLYNPKVVRSTMGSLFHLPIVQADLAEAVKQLIDRGFRILGTSLEGAVAYDQASYHGPVAIIIGNEANGVSRPLLDHCSQKVKIPIYGQAESLNAAIAAAIVMYEAVRQRREGCTASGG